MRHNEYVFTESRINDWIKSTSNLHRDGALMFLPLRIDFQGRKEQNIIIHSEANLQLNFFITIFVKHCLVSPPSGINNN